MTLFSSRRRHTRWPRDWSSDVCSSDLLSIEGVGMYLGNVTGHGSSVDMETLVPTNPNEGLGVVEQKPSKERDSLIDRKSTRLNSSHVAISYAVFCLK